MNPHPALDPNVSPEEQAEAATVYRQLLIQGALACLLPTEDLQNTSLRILVTDIIADLILGRAINDKLCESWFVHGMVSKVVETITARAQPKVTGAEIQADARGRLEKFGLLSAQSENQPANSPKTHQSQLGGWFWAGLQYVYLAYLSLRFFVIGMMQSRRHTLAKARDDSGSDLMILNYRLFTAISTLLSASGRMPWLFSLLSFWQHVFTVTFEPFGSVLDR